MAQRRFDILFDGSVINGADRLQVKQQVQALFKLTDADVERLFSGNPLAIKRNLDRQTAARYQAAMTKAGAKIQLVLSQEETEHRSNNSVEHDRPNLTSSDQRLTLSPTGSDLLSHNERKTVEAVDVDTSSLTLDTVAANKSSTASFEAKDIASKPDKHDPSTQRYPDNDHIELKQSFGVAQAGERLSEAQQQTAPAIDIEYLSALEAGTPLLSEDEKQQSAPPQKAIDLENLQLDLAEPGEDLLQAHEKQTTPEANINISNLTLAD